MGLVPNFYQTASVQWLERTLDDSAIRRMDIPQVFLLTDAILLLAENITNQDGDPSIGRPLTFYPERIKTILEQELPFMTTEAILMDLAHAGYDRQDMHELIKKHSVAAWLDIKEEGKENNLFERLGEDVLFPLSEDDLAAYLDNPQRYAWAAVDQTEEFLRDIVFPKIHAYKEVFAGTSHVKLAV